MNVTNDKAPPPGACSQEPNASRARGIAEKVATAAKVPGMSIAIAGPDGVLFAHAVGYADLAERRPASVHDQYPWFSMTKIATATTAVRLHSEGKLNLDAPVGTYLSGYQPDQRHGHPTSRHMLTHTAGLGNPMPIRWVRPEGGPEDPDLIARIT